MPSGSGLSWFSKFFFFTMNFLFWGLFFYLSYMKAESLMQCLFSIRCGFMKTSHIVGADNTVLDVKSPRVYQTGRWHFVLCPFLTNWEIEYGLEQLCWGQFWMSSSFKNSPGEFWLKTECCYLTRAMCEEFSIFAVTFWNYFSYWKSGFKKSGLFFSMGALLKTGWILRPLYEKWICQVLWTLGRSEYEDHRWSFLVLIFIPKSRLSHS